MKLIFSRSHSVLSVIIRGLTGDPVSHFAFVFDSPAGGMMFESNLLGTHPKFFKNAKKHMKIVYELDFNISVSKEDKIWDRVVDYYDGKSYDFAGALYLGWRVFLERVFKIKRPRHNKWSKAKAFYCDELYDSLKGVGLPNLNVSGGMETPYEVYLKLVALGVKP